MARIAQGFRVSQTRAASDLSSHPLPFFFDYGLRVTMNTDNRLVTNTTVSKELFLCHTEFGFTPRYSTGDAIESYLSGVPSRPRLGLAAVGVGSRLLQARRESHRLRSDRGATGGRSFPVAPCRGCRPQRCCQCEWFTP